MAVCAKIELEIAQLEAADASAFLADLEEARHRYHDDWVSANLVKFFADGATGLVPPLVYEPHEYAALVMELDRRGFQLMTHAARDDSVHMIVDAYEQLERANGPRDRRLRIEHADLTDAVDIPRFATLSVIVDMQPSFCCGEEGLNYDAANPLPKERWKSFQESGATVAFSSDWPCTWPPSPFVGIEEAVTRNVWRSPDTAAIHLTEPVRVAPLSWARCTCPPRGLRSERPSRPTPELPRMRRSQMPRLARSKSANSRILLSCPKTYFPYHRKRSVKRELS